MTLSDDLRRLAAFVDQLEARGIPVEDAVPRGRNGEALTVELEVTLTPETDLRGAESADTTPADEGTECETGDDAAMPGDATDAGEDTGPTLVEPAVVVANEPIPTIVATEGEVGRPDGEPEAEAGRVSCQHGACDAAFETAHGMKIHYTKVHVSGGETAPHRDPEKLRAVYETCDTFEEMRDELGATVTPATVRHHLIEHGIHEPTPNAATTAADTSATDAEPAVEPTDEETDAAEATEVIDPKTEIREGITVEQLVDSVSTASTVYDVERALALDREETTALLDTLDILEIVHGRVATKPDRDALRSEIDERIRANVEP
ncbi:hypothetical protein [Natronomonas sp. EA1]|uniref:hypothetical protein n=1 Tax=Natronomonas sp. EA1 TaxID=3421655 RepID=UPI003EC1558C